MTTLRNCFLVLFFSIASVAVRAAEPVDVNTADSETLVDRLVGVGPQKAMEIVRYRQAHGPFKQVDELVNVKGIGQKLVEQNRSRLVAVPASARVNVPPKTK